MRKYDIDKLHETLIEILDYFVDICEKNNLRYCLIYGSALGAYRHSGFIPWDDDLDVAMPREDYNKMLLIMEKENANYTIQNETNEKSWFLTFSKIRKKGTIFLEGISDGLYVNNGIYIDIFPLDYVRNNNLQNVIRENLIGYLRHSLKFVSCPKLYKTKYHTLRYYTEAMITLPVNFRRKDAAELLRKLCVGSCVEKEAKYFAEHDDSKSLQIPKEYYFPARKMLFENKYYNVPNRIEDYLEKIYGSNYMELPPESERITHDPLKVQF